MNKNGVAADVGKIDQRNAKKLCSGAPIERK
jgi:hypothetical protein